MISKKMSKEPIADAMADCVLPEDMMLCILTRLPVKSLLRFKSVCKAWRELFATPKFIKMHQDQFSSDPENQAFIIYKISEDAVGSISLCSIESNAKRPTNIDLPHQGSFLAMYSVGCCNGLVCIGFLSKLVDLGIVLWNPALRLSKSVLCPRVDLRFFKKFSFGFGYDDEGDDFKVVEIFCFGGKDMWVGVEVYSAKSDTWETIKLDFRFRVLRMTNDAIVNGNPYWIAKVVENGSLKNHHGDVLVWCDVTKLEFKMVPLSTLKLEKVAEVPFVDWKGSLAALVCNKNNDKLESLDVWVFDDGEMMWRKNHSFGPIEMKVDWCLQCSKHGKIIGDCLDGKLSVFDPGNGWVKEIEVNEGRNYKICGYYESLAYVKGMEQIVVTKKEEEAEDDE